MKTMLLKAGLLMLLVAGSIMKGATQSAEADTLLMERYDSVVDKAMFNDRAATLRACDSMEQLAQRMDWPEKRMEVWLLRTQNASVFADTEDLLRCLQQMDKLLPQYKNRLSDLVYARFLEETYSFWGVLHFRKGNLVKTLAVSLELTKILLGKPNPSADVYERLFAVNQLIARTYAAAGDYQKAVDYYLISIENKPGFAKTTMRCVNALYQIGDIYRTQGQLNKTGAYYMQALDSLNMAIRADGPDKWFGYAVNLHRRLGLYYADQQLFNTAFEHFQTALAYAKPGTPFVSAILDNMGATYGKINQPEKALEHLNRSIGLKQKSYGKNSENVAETLLLIAEIYQQQGDYSAGLVQCQKVLGMLADEPLDTNGYNNPVKDPKGRQKLYLQALGKKLAALSELYQQNPARIELLDASSKTLQISFRLMDHIRTEYTAGSDKQFLVDNSRPLYEMAIDVALHQQHLRELPLPVETNINKPREQAHGNEEAFLFAEKTKSLLLYEGIQESNALKFSGIPDSLLQKEYNLRVDIAYYEQKSFTLENKGTLPTDSTLLALNSNIFKLRQEYEDLKKTFETAYPDYYRLKYNLRVEDIASVQRDLLSPDMAIVEYFVGDSAVYIFSIHKNDYHVVEVKKDFPLESWVAQLRTGLTYFQTGAADTQYVSLSTSYTEAAFNIYQKLIAPIASELPQRVVFIPDGVLGYVPFEILLAEKPVNPTRWNTHHYLLHDHIVSYCYSATMLREMLFREHQQQPSIQLLGFAPAYKGDGSVLDSLYASSDIVRKNLMPLPNSGEEVYRIAKLMQGKAFVGREASETTFTKLAGQARILHLATHGQANDQSGDYCFLVFAEQKDSLENETLYASDIYNLQLNADLVTLSACETGIGELQGGEGIISLARAFAYAGAKSIVTSLWSVSDLKTKDLMVDFYKNLRTGMLKDDALRQAKLDFIKRNKGMAAHPFYWAGFVGIGNMGAVR